MIRISITSAVLFASIAMGSGCAKHPTANANAAPEVSPGTTERQTTDTGMGMTAAGDECPMTVPGTTVQMAETPDGAAMAYTTTGDVAELRRRVHAMADHINAQWSGGAGMHGMMHDMGGANSADGGRGMMTGEGMGSDMMGSGRGPGASDMMGGADGGAAMGGGLMSGMHAQAEDIEGGARLRITPSDPSRLAGMRQHMQQHAQMMNQSGRCPMMSR